MVKLWLNYGFTTSDPKRHKLWFIYGLTMAQLWFNYDSTMVKLWLNYARQKNTGHVFGDAAFFAPKSHKNHFRFPTCVLCFGWYSFGFPAISIESRRVVLRVGARLVCLVLGWAVQGGPASGSGGGGCARVRAGTWGARVAGRVRLCGALRGAGGCACSC